MVRFEHNAIAAIVVRRAAMSMQCRLERDTAIMVNVAQAALGDSGSFPNEALPADHSPVS
jgi:hypothetical protein